MVCQLRARHAEMAHLALSPMARLSLSLRKSGAQGFLEAHGGSWRAAEPSGCRQVKGKRLQLGPSREEISVCVCVCGVGVFFKSVLNWLISPLER